MRKGFARVLSRHALLAHLLRNEESTVAEMHYFTYLLTTPPNAAYEPKGLLKTIRVREAKTC